MGFILAIKDVNLLLDEDFSVKLFSFGQAKLRYLIATYNPLCIDNAAHIAPKYGRTNE